MPGHPAGRDPMPLRWGIATLVGAFVLLQLPFAGQAFVIDDGNFVDQALQIADDPGAPYSFKIQLGVAKEFFSYFANPPAQAYYLAAVIKLLGRSEVILHGACLLFAALALFSMYALAREITGRGVFAALLLLGSPAYLVSSHTVMSDVAAASLYFCSVYLFLRGVDDDRLPLLVLAGLVAGLCGLFKYSGITVVALMVLYLLIRRCIRFRTLLPPLIAAAVFGAWCWISYRSYGQVHVLAAFFLEATPKTAGDRVIQAVASLVQVGGTTVFPPMLWLWSIHGSFSSSRVAGWLVAVASTIAFCCALPAYSHPLLDYDLPNRLLGGLLLGAGVAALAFVIVRGGVAIRELLRGSPSSEPARSLMLVAWFLGIAVMNANLVFASPKYLIPAVAPLILLLLGRAQDTRRSPGPWFRSIAVAGAMLVASGLSLVNAVQGNCHRRMVQEVVPGIAAGAPVWFNGHWSVRYYSEREGHRWLAARPDPASQPRPGDHLFIVTEAPMHDIPRPVARAMNRVDARTTRSPLPLQLMNRGVGAGYWAHVYGVMPYVFTTKPLSTTLVFRSE